MNTKLIKARVIDAYAPEAGERAVLLPLTDAFEIRNTSSKRLSSTGHVLRFKQLGVMTVSQTERTLQYTYDALSRLIVADDGVSPVTYGYDLAGNLVNVDGTTRTYNAANQMTHDGTNTLTYDPNGNLTSDGTNTYIWDRANRLLSMGGVSYGYDGDGNRIQQNALEYILDLQPGLAQVIGDSDGKRYIHAPRGIHAVQNPFDTWTHPLTDGLGSVRGYVDAHSNPISSVTYTELGVPDGAWEGFAFTGEMLDASGLQYHRARYYAPSLGVFPSLDPWEGIADRPMSLNGYSWVEGNVVNATDASGMCPENPWWNDIPGQRCVYLVNRLCDIHGCSEAGRQALMRLDLGELETLTLAETVSYWGGFGRWTGERVAIIPSLFGENPSLALQAIQEFVSCGGGGNMAFSMAAVAVPGMPGIGGSGIGAGATGLGMLGALGIVAVVGLGLLAQEYTRSLPRVQDRTRLRRNHISLGFNFNGDRKPILFFFTLNLNKILNPENVYVFSYGDWFEQALSSNHAFNDVVFRQAATNAERIHFNLEGINGDIREYIEKFGNRGSFSGSISFPATELYIIRTEGYCQKTTFWDNGSTAPIPNRTIPLLICPS